MKILITGGAGFVGRNMIRFIRRAIPAASILVVDTLSEDPESFFRQGLDRAAELHVADVRDYVPHALVDGDRFDLCIHLAAVVGGRQKIEGEPLAVAQDLAIDATVINGVHAGLADELMYFSSSAAYPRHLQADEDAPALRERMIDVHHLDGSPDLTYGWAKLTGEFLCSFLTHTKVTIFRPFSGYGEDQAPTYPFPAIMRRIRDGEDPVVVWGSGMQIRDWIHIEDVCRMAFELHRAAPSGEVYNLGTGLGTTFDELVRTALDVCGRTAEITADASKPEGVFCRYADTAKARALGVWPTIGLPEGIERWMEANA